MKKRMILTRLILFFTIFITATNFVYANSRFNMTYLYFGNSSSFLTYINKTEKSLPKEMLDQATLSLKSDINRLDFKMDSKFDEVKSEIHDVKSIVEAVKSDSASTRLLMEEKRNENRILYDHVNMMFDRQTRFEEKTDRIQNKKAIKTTERGNGDKHEQYQ